MANKERRENIGELKHAARMRTIKSALKRHPGGGGRDSDYAKEVESESKKIESMTPEQLKKHRAVTSQL
jgi:hypothetical protein